MNVMNEFQYFLSTEGLIDVTIACDGQSINAHKIILAAFSPFFRSLFTRNPCKHPIVILKNIKYTELKLVIDFMYSGEVNVTEDQFSAVINTAKALRVKGLEEIMFEKQQSNGKISSHVMPNSLISKVLKNQSGAIFNFKWGDHMHIRNEFKNFLLTETMIDVTLICEGQSLKGHKLMLAAYSPFFRSLFFKNPCKHPVVILNDMKYSDLRSVINFMYCTEKIPDEQLSSVIEIAHTFKVKGLMEFESHNNPCSDESGNLTVNSSENQLTNDQSQQPVCTIDVSNWTFMLDQSRNGQNVRGGIAEIKQEIIPDDTDLCASYTNTATVLTESLSQDTNLFVKSEQNRPVEQDLDKDFALEDSYEGSTLNAMLLQTSTTDNDLICEKQIVSLDNEAVNSPMHISKSPDKKRTNRSRKLIPLPEFSPVLKPLLNGDKLTEKQHSALSSALKDQLISYLNHEKLICTGSSSALRWHYRNLGESLARKYPKMLFDLPSRRQKKLLKKDAPVYTIFIRRLSERRKMQRLRQKAKETDFAVDEVESEVSQKAKEKTADCFAGDTAEGIKMSTADALEELVRTVTQETVKNKENIERIHELLKISFDIRKKDNMLELPPYLMAQTCLETEVELHFASSIADMEKKIQEVLMKMSSTYSVPGTILELEKLMQSKTSTCSAVTMGEYTSEQKRPGPSIFYGSDKLLFCRDQLVYLEKDCSLERATILLLGVYYILNLNFPEEYHQFLCFLENIVVKTKRFPMQFYTPHLIQIMNNLCS